MQILRSKHSNTTTRLSFLNDLKRLTSIKAVAQNHFLESLPRATKIFVLASVLDAIFIMALSIEQLVVVRRLSCHSLSQATAGPLLSVYCIILHYSCGLSASCPLPMRVLIPTQF